MKPLGKFFRKTISFFETHKKLVITAVVILVVFRLWLFVTMNWFINFQTYYDGRLEMNTAVDIASGSWAGAYSKFTLCKSLAFPLFLAFSLITHIPYAVCLFGVALLASFLFARSLKPLIRDKKWRVLIFLFALYSPTGLGCGAVYPYRIALTSWAVLIVIACIIAIYLRRGARIKKLIPWALAGFLTAGFFWNLREDSVWFLPFIVCGCVAIIIHYLLDSRRQKKKKNLKEKVAFMVVAVCPLLGILAWNTTISAINYVNYGVWTTEDRTKTYAAKVLGALIRIDDGADLESDYWVSNEALELAKEVSPTLNSINTEAFDKWSKIGDYSIWALRDSVEASGYYVDAAETNELYRKIYDELEQGFRDGKIKKKDAIQLSDTSGIYTFNEILQPVGIAFESLIKHVSYDEYVVGLEKPINSINEGDYVYYENVLMTNIWRDDEELAKIGADASLIKSNNLLRDKLRLNRFTSNVLVKIYNVIGWVMFMGAIIGFFVTVYMVLKKKDYSKFRVEMLILMLGLILTALLYGYLVGLWGLGYHLTAGDNLFQCYTTPMTVLVACFEVIGVYYLVAAYQGRKKKKK